MKRIFASALALSLALPMTVALPGGDAQARHKTYPYKEWRGRDGRLHCRKPDGTTGLVIGAVGGALIGRSIDTDGDRTMGTVLGAAAGGLIGREIDRGGRRCR